jgi:ATP-dependent helicase/nuclease subunit B
VITPRTITLWRAPDLQTLHDAVARLTSGTDPLAARAAAVLVPTRGAAEALRRTLENRALAVPGAVAILPDLLTRGDFYGRLHQSLPGAPSLLSEFEREVLVRRAARLASESGSPAPFRLRAGLIVEILALYDDLRRRGRTVADFERLMNASLEGSADSDRGAERMLRQTHFLVAVFRELERRVAATGRIDEHGLRARLLDDPGGCPYRQIVLTIGDQAGEARGLWLADYDLLAQVAGVERIDLLATEQVLAAGLHQRMHDTFPGLSEQRLDASSSVPTLAAPERPDNQPAVRWFVSRDREEELADAARLLKQSPVSERTALVFQRPLPYLYLARSVFADAGVPYQALDARPLAAEPFAAALDLVFEVAMSEATRAPLVDLLGSPHWSFAEVEAGVDQGGVAAFDALLRELKYLGGWDRLEALASEPLAPAADRTGRLRARAQPAVQAAASAAREIRSAIEAPTASAQFARLVDFIRRHERLPGTDDPVFPDHARARAAILGALGALAEAHAAHDDEALLVTELANTVRRWIEGQTFSPRTGHEGVTLLDAQAAAYADVDDVRLIGLVEGDWPERSRRSIFYPASLLGQLGWPNEIDRLTAARARFHDLLRLARGRVSISTFTLEDDAIVAPSPFVEEIETCGLEVRPVARVASPRVFVQQALREAPAAPDGAAAIQPAWLADRPAQAEWLAVRASRSPAAAPAFHGAAGPRPAAVYAVSHVERYLECPFKYFASYVLGLDEERDEDAGLSPRERGQFLHEVFQQFFVAWAAAGHRSITAGTLQEALTIFETVVESRLARLSDVDRALERTYLLGSAAAPGLAERAFAFEIEQGVAVVERLLEHALEGEFALQGDEGPVRLRLRGKADRIDLLDDGTLRIVDYKLGRAPKPGRALQLPVYGVCASQQLEGRHGRSWPLSRAGYVAFREKNAFVSLGATPAQAAQALEDGQRRMVAAVAGIERGAFPVDPDEPFLCTRCGYAGVCRKDYVGDE